MKIKAPLIFIKWTNYEYWTWWVFYIPLLPYWLWLSIKTKSLAFFTATNTNIELGGFFGESKIDILKQIPHDYLPKAFSVKQGLSFDEIQGLTEINQFVFPFIVKPNVGKRGFAVEKINTVSELKKYHASANYDCIIQEFIDYPIELGVLFYRLPDEQKGYVTSITIKEFLTVTGDGKSSILELMQQSKRARFQIKAMKEKLGEEINRVLLRNEKCLLEPIGNHCRGTKFINGNDLINDKLHSVFNEIAKNINGFYFGRFDLKVKSIEDLYCGSTIKIMELNGASSEPGHIYDASYGLIPAYKNIMYHWKILAEIATQNKKKGIKPVPFKVMLRTFYQHFFN